MSYLRSNAPILAIFIHLKTDWFISIRLSHLEIFSVYYNLKLRKLLGDELMQCHISKAV